jgi:gamma-glutamylcyclotransferase (GGCT)/AIG2-like uncharacterized protein YtfP
MKSYAKQETTFKMNDGQLDLIKCAEQLAIAATALTNDAQADWFRLLEPAVKVATAVGALVGGIWALVIYRRGKRREAAQWMHDIFQRFQLGSEFDRAKLIFDFQYSDLVEPIHAALVAGGNAALDPSKRGDSQHVDRLLNYLEHLVYLADNGHAKWSDCMAYFQYWLDLLSDPERGALRRYLVRFGYEGLARVARASPDDFLLLYGSLGRGEAMHNKLGLNKALQRVGVREIQGTLYDLGDFPGLVLGSGVVVAELFKILDLSVFSRLDEFEEYDHTNPETSLYRRTTIQLLRYRGRIASKLYGHPMIDPWIYVYNQPVDDKRKIEEPSWQEYKRKRQNTNGQSGSSDFHL